MRWQLTHLSWPELRHQPWRHASALLAVVLGVALAFSVHLINASALGEFSAAVRQVDGEADFELRAQQEGFDEALYARVAAHPQIQLASPLIDLAASAQAGGSARVALRLIGQDALVAARLAPQRMPQPGAGADRLAVVDPDALYLNAEARRQLGGATMVDVQTDAGRARLAVRGSIAAAGGALAVLDIAGVQAHFGWLGRLSRIDVRLAPGADRAAVIADLQLPAGIRVTTPAEAAGRVSNVSRAYRVNLTVLALVALFTGAFLVFSILSLSVARRLPQFALLGVLGLAPRERLALVLAESALLGIVGSVLGIAVGTALAMAALRLLGGDLGGGYFAGVSPALHFDGGAALAYGLLGVAAALVGGWLPARAAQQMAPAQALKGYGGGTAGRGRTGWIGPALLAGGVGLALLPPVAGLPLGAYVSIALLLLGGIACVPALIGLLLGRSSASDQPLWLLAVQRAQHERASATIAVAGVVASLALSVALTVMVASFREAVIGWLDTVLPADAYARSVEGRSGAPGFLAAELAAQISRLPAVARVEAQRVLQLQIAGDQPPVALIVRPLADPAAELPLAGEVVATPAGAVPVHVSQAVVALYGARPGTAWSLPLPDGRLQPVFVASVWRDYARQSGAVMMSASDYQRLTGDRRINDLAIWLRPAATLTQLQAQLREQVGIGAADAAVELASTGEIRTRSLQLFDRSFAVTYWLQAVAIAIGLFGIAASFSAQVLARRREFGLLVHLGLTRGQVLRLVTSEGALWTAVGMVIGLGLGIAVSVVLVEVVNPQSFHWTMPLLLPWPRLLPLCGAVLVAGTLTAWLAARRAADHDAVLAVKDDW